MSLVVLSALAAALAAAAPDDARLAAGEVLVTSRAVPGSEVPEVTARAVINAPPMRVWSVVSECAGYKGTMPNIVESAQLSATPGDAHGSGSVRVCRVRTELPFPLGSLASTNRAVHTVEPGVRWERRWELIEGDYEHLTGMWRVVPWGDGSRSLVTYTLHARPRLALPASLVAQANQRKLPDMIEAVRRRVVAQPPR